MGASDREMLETLEALGHTGVRSAAAGMSEMLGETVTPRGLRVRRSGIPDMLGFLQGQEERALTVALSVRGDAEGDLLLILSSDTARMLEDRLTASLDVPAAERERVRRDSVAELANVIGTAFLNAVSEASGLELLPYPPSLAEDFVAAACDVFQIRYGELADSVLVTEVDFAAGGTPLRLHLCILFGQQGWDRILQGLQRRALEGG